MIEYFLAAPVATIIFIVTIVTSFIAFQNPAIKNNWMLNPFRFVHQKRYHTIITSGFIHGDFAHLFFNMTTFYFFAFSLEENMVLLDGFAGHFIFLFLYIASMVIADISSVVKHKDNPNYNSLGASGAIAAVMFSDIIFMPNMRLIIIFLPIPGGISTPVFALGYMAYCIYAGRKSFDNVNHDAHLWGAIAGVLFTLIFFPGIFPYFLQHVKHIF